MIGRQLTFFSMTKKHTFARKAGGFSLIEVVLAIGIFLVTILALVGMLGPSLKSIDEVEQTDEVASVVNTLNAFLQGSTNIGIAQQSKFETIYDAVASNGYATVFIYRAYRDTTSLDTILKVGFWGERAGAEAQLDAGDFQSGSVYLAAGTIYRVVLSPSSTLPDSERTDLGQGSFPRYRLVHSTAATYEEGYFAMEARIFAEDPGPSFVPSRAPEALQGLEPIFLYNVAINR